MKKVTGFTPPAVGISSLLVIFAVLCLCVFSLLSLSTVQADRRLSDAARASVENYYRADSQAQQILARLRNGENVPGVTEENGVFAYGCALSDSQMLAVQVALEGSDYTVLRWQVISTAYWEAEDKLPVWGAS